MGLPEPRTWLTVTHVTPNEAKAAAELDRINAQIADLVRIEMARQRIGPKMLSESTGIALATLKRRLARERATPFKPHELIAVGRAIGVDYRTFLPDEEAAA
jgi:hypothetical protein